MASVIAGETDKMAILYERYKKPLYAYFFRVTRGNCHSSEDLVHTVFYRVMRYKSTYTGQGNFMSWLFRIAHNAAIDHNRLFKSAENYRSEIYASGVTSFDPDELDKRDQYKMLELAMNKLPVEEREMLVLGKIDGMKYRDIADIMNTTENNVKIKIFRALKKLKDIYSAIEKKEYEKIRH
jgi:RNA polymerase sigma-70 factor (ECF subfamily)